ncbi:Rgp1-domain-containing protein [Piromyces finnis]|uniref:Rgp1-domain-containing protein n=1 Tax=Piromyces finnis TaxID=1754191 RepID=A0A1Y1VLB6_9FUNG|nr:Rgp1-domain-containing protein [Piromyces finnis]|eukprot:ORX59248.1 Rgp1-domain-containing protein [Piromyces finnis]
MPVIVKASFPKKNKDALFWGGEQVTCTIKITNSTFDTSKNLQDKKIKNVVVPPSNDVFVKSKSVIRRRKSIDTVKKLAMETNKNKNEKPELTSINTNLTAGNNSSDPINNNNNQRRTNTNDESFSLKKLFRRSMSFLLNEETVQQELDNNKNESSTITTTTSSTNPTPNKNGDDKGKLEGNDSSTLEDTSSTFVQRNVGDNSHSHLSQISTTQTNFISDISSPNTTITNFDYDESNLMSAGPLSASVDAMSQIYQIKELNDKSTQININTKAKAISHSQNPALSVKSNEPNQNANDIEIKKIELSSESLKNNDDASSQDSHITDSTNTGSFKRLNNTPNTILYSLDKKSGEKVQQHSMSSTSLNSDFEIKSYYNNSSSNLLENSINNSLANNSNNSSNGTLSSSSSSNKSSSTPTAKSIRETISIGYIQVMGKCTLDGNHINLNLFESLKSKIRYGSKVGGGGSIGYDIDRTNDPRYNRVDIPIYSTAPGILFCNLSLEPGETKIFDYSIVLPTSLPPTYYGRSIKINYSVHIGIQKTPLNTTPYSITLPFKVFSYADDDGSKPAYDILNPVIINKDLSTISQRSTESLDLIHSPLPYTPIETNHAIKIDEGSSFRNVCQLCQQASKVSYEICKDNENVAQLLFTRSVYRLGESIIGIIKFKTNALRCYQVTTYLETDEQIEYPYALRSKGKGGRVTKKVIAHQQDFCLNNSKIFVELPIPLFATPEFNINAVNLKWFLRFEFITSSNEKIMNIDSKNNNFIHSTGITNSNVETFDCKIPIKVYGSKYGIQSNKTNDFVSIYI